MRPPCLADHYRAMPPRFASAGRVRMKHPPGRREAASTSPARHRLAQWRDGPAVAQGASSVDVPPKDNRRAWANDAPPRTVPLGPAVRPWTDNAISKPCRRSNRQPDARRQPRSARRCFCLVSSALIRSVLTLAASTVTREEDGHGAGAVVGAGWSTNVSGRAGRGAQCPGSAGPFPRGAAVSPTDVAAKKYRLAAGAVVRHGVVATWGRACARESLGPGRAVPSPRPALVEDGHGASPCLSV